MPERSYREANRRYRRVFIPTMIVYALLALGGAFVLRALHEAPVWMAASVAVLTTAPMLVMLLLMWRLANETDEYTRQRQFAAMAAGGLITAGVAMVWGFLELYVGAPRLWTFLLGPTFLLAYGLVYRLHFKGACEPGFEA